MKSIIQFSTLLMYGWIILNWFLMFRSLDAVDFLDMAEARVGVEVLFLSAGFFLVATVAGVQTKQAKRAFWGIFVAFLLLGFFITKDNGYGLLSVAGVFTNYLVEYFSQTGDFGEEASDNFTRGKGGIFRFVLLVLYGLPIGFLFQYLGYGNNAFMICAGIIGYYIILLLIELNNALNRN